MLSIGDLAAYTGETVKTLRYWSEQGLLHYERGDNGYRYYQPDTAERVAFIRSAQALGFSLKAIGTILTLRSEGVTPCDHVRADLREHLLRVQERITKLRALEQELSERLTWAETDPTPDCNTEGCIYLLTTS